MSQRYYDILGVSKKATITEIKDAYERLCKEYEPSDHQFDPEYVKRYNEVQEAFDWLKNNHMWTINVEEENNDETAPPKQPDKQEKLIDLRYVLLAAIVLSCAICYLFVSPYLGSGSSQTVIVSNHERNVAETKLNEDALDDSYSLFRSDGYTGSLKDYVELLNSNEEALVYSYDLFKGAGYTKSLEAYRALMGIEDQPTEDNLKRLYESALTEFDMPDYEQFKLDMRDEDKLAKFRESMSQHFTMPDLNTLKKYIGFTKTDATKSPNTTTTLSHGSNPYGYCYTSNKSCSSRCSEIKVSASSRVGTIVIIKQKSISDGTVVENVVRCAYIDKGRTFAFKLPNGTYTPYFYSGTGWSNKKYMKTTTQCGRLYGGFTAGESVGKDTPQTLNNQILSYDLNTQYDGNFQTKSSDVSEAF